MVTPQQTLVAGRSADASRRWTRQIARPMNLRLPIALLAAVNLAACGGASTGDGSSDDLRRRRDGGTRHDGGTGHDGGVHDGGIGADAGLPGDAGTPGSDAGVPPGGSCATDNDCLGGGLCSAGACVASACNQRHASVTGLRATVRISQYLGLIQGRNGTHELANGTLQNVSWIFQPSVEDTTSVQLAMNVASAIDSQGLPREIPLTSGEVIEVEGEYIPAARANSGGRAVIHFTHGACGFVEIAGVIY